MKIDFNLFICIKMSCDNLGSEISNFFTQLRAFTSCERYRTNLMLQRSTSLKNFVKDPSTRALINMLAEEII